MIAPADGDHFDDDDTARMMATEAAALCKRGMPLVDAVNLTGADPRETARRLRSTCLPYMPTPDEITAAAESIRATWTPAERARRLVGVPAGPLRVPTVAVRDIANPAA